MFRYINTVVFEHMNLGTSTISTLTRFQLDRQIYKLLYILKLAVCFVSDQVNYINRAAQLHRLEI